MPSRWSCWARCSWPFTGAEALYADLGHFGRRPIMLAWLVLVFPALALNYLGQGALVLTDPTTLDNPFFKMGPGRLAATRRWWCWPPPPP